MHMYSVGHCNRMHMKWWFAPLNSSDRASCKRWSTVWDKKCTTVFCLIYIKNIMWFFPKAIVTFSYQSHSILQFGSQLTCCTCLMSQSIFQIHDSLFHDFLWTLLTLCFFLSVATPLSLQQLSRLAVRKKLGTSALKVIGQLNIPKLIISYLCYQWVSPGGGVASMLKDRLKTRRAAAQVWEKHNKGATSLDIIIVDTHFSEKHNDLTCLFQNCTFHLKNSK